MKIMLASPLYERIEPDAVVSINALRDVLRDRGDDVPPWSYRRGLVYDARNGLVVDALKTGADVLVQIDHDHIFQADDVVAAVDFACKAHVVGFAHPFRRPHVQGPLGPLCSPQLLPEIHTVRRVVFQGHTYIDVAKVGAGILVTSRFVLQTLYDRSEATGRKVFTFAQGLGEDLQFCLDWRALGGHVWCDLEANIGHIGPFVYRASLQEELDKIGAVFAEDPRDAEAAAQRRAVQGQPALTKLLPPPEEEETVDPEMAAEIERFMRSGDPDD